MDPWTIVCYLSGSVLFLGIAVIWLAYELHNAMVTVRSVTDVSGYVTRTAEQYMPAQAIGNFIATARRRKSDKGQ